MRPVYQRIGFAGYKEFRQAVTCEVAVRRFSHAGQSPQEIFPSDSMEDIVEKVTQKNILSLEDSKNLLDAETLNACVERLTSARTVLLFGLGASLYAARDAYLKFLRLGKPCVINDDWSSQLLQAGPPGKRHPYHRHYPLHPLPGGGSGRLPALHHR